MTTHDSGRSSEAGLVAALRPRVAARLSPARHDQVAEPAWREQVGRAVGDVLDGYARELLTAGRTPPEAAFETRIRRMLVHAFTGAGALQALLDDPEIETINVNGADNVWVHLRDGTRQRVGAVAASDQELVALLQDLGARAGVHERRFSSDSPELSMQLPGGARLHALQQVSDRVCVSIRRHPMRQVHLEDLVRLGTLTAGMRQLLVAMVRARRNLVVSGGPAVGKTTLLRALAHAIPSEERIITVEDAYELAIDSHAHPNLVAMQARLPNVEGAGQFTADDCVRASLRLAPDRVLVGEVRGPEVVTMCKAMSIGIDGSLATVHASSSRQAFLRLVTYAMEPPASYSRDAAVALVAGAVHAVIHLERAASGTRVISSIREVVGEEDGQVISNEIFQPGPDRRAVPAARVRDDTLDRLVAAGFDPAWLAETGRWEQ